MQTIVQALKEGTAKERLAIIADLTSIIGVSVASIVGGAVALTGTASLINIRFSEVIAAIIYSLLCLACAVIVLAGFLSMLSFVSRLQFKHVLVRPLIYVAAWSLLVAATLFASFFYVAVLRSFAFTL